MSYEQKMHDLQLNWREITPTRAVNGAAFPQGTIDLNFSVGRPFGMLWNKSYFRVGLTLTKAGLAPDIADATLIALADNAPACLFNNIYARVGGQDISSLVNYAPQASQVKQRLSKSGAWLDTIGKAAFGMDPDLASRHANTATRRILLGKPAPEPAPTIAITQATRRVVGVNTLLNTGESKLEVGDVIVVNGNPYTISVAANDDLGADCKIAEDPGGDIAVTANAYKRFGANNTVYINFQPPLGIFDHGEVMGSGDYRLQMNPNAYFKTAIVQTIDDLAVAGYDVVVNDLRFYLATVNSDSPATDVQHLRLVESHVQSKPLGNADSLLDFVVPPSTQSISVFVQAPTANNTTQFPPTLFKALPYDQDEILTSIQISYAGENKPSVRWQSESKEPVNGANGSDLSQQRYLDTQLYSGRIWSEGGAESYADWKKRGGLYHFSFTRDASDRSTQLQVASSWSNLPANSMLFVVAHFTRAVSISTENGLVTSVESMAV